MDIEEFKREMQTIVALPDEQRELAEVWLHLRLTDGISTPTLDRIYRKMVKAHHRKKSGSRAGTLEDGAR